MRNFIIPISLLLFVLSLIGLINYAGITTSIVAKMDAVGFLNGAGVVVSALIGTLVATAYVLLSFFLPRIIDKLKLVSKN